MIVHLDTHVVARLYAGERELFPSRARAARTLSWTRDPFDRLITAAAIGSNSPLLTRDQMIRDHYDGAFWDA